MSMGMVIYIFLISNKFEQLSICNTQKQKMLGTYLSPLPVFAHDMTEGRLWVLSD